MSVLLVDIDGRADGVLQVLQGHNMVVMAMSQQDHGAFHAELLQSGQDFLLALGARVHDGAQAAFLVAQQIAVGSQRPHPQRFDFHGLHPFFFIIWSVSIKIVTGPSFTWSIFISAPKTPLQ